MNRRLVPKFFAQFLVVGAGDEMAIPEEGKFGIFNRAPLNQAADITEIYDTLNVAINPHHGGFNGGF